MDGLASADIAAITASLNYLAPMQGRPASYTFEPPPGVPWRTGRYDPQPVAIRDGRVAATGLSLDAQGFLFAKAPSAVPDLTDELQIRALYYPEVERIVRERSGAARVVAFDHNLRRAGQPGGVGVKEPVTRVHNDFTANSGPRRAADELTQRGESLERLKGRFAIINLWRPLRGPVEDVPLAVCDAASIAPRDFVPADLIYRDRVGETYSVTFNAAHRWFFFPHMTRDEVLLIKCFDTAEDGRARFTAHSAFENPAAAAGAPPRESIEVRTLALFPA